MKPLHDRIVVKPSEKESVTASGIVLPDTAQEKPLKGEVIAVGPGKVLDSGKIAELEVKVSDIVLYGKYSGTEVKVGGEDVVILRQDDVLAIIDGSSAKAKPAADTKKQKANKKGKK
jgi:chaperonin GroES